ncbi:MAG: hypothetical protein CMB32_01190 [Euryarchaeota archaeon]|nr:hypothetical protein [Euryarchaeota archaeon]
MRKNIDIDDSLVLKLKVFSAFENTTVKKRMEEAVEYYIAMKEKERMDALTPEEKEDLGLLMLMQQANLDSTVSREKVMKELDK